MVGTRERVGIVIGVFVAFMAVVLIGMVASGQRADTGPSELARAGLPATAADTDTGDPGLEEERDEQREGTERRIEAWKAAERAGTAGQAGRRSYARSPGATTPGLAPAAAPAPAWVGEIPISTTAEHIARAFIPPQARARDRRRAAWADPRASSSLRSCVAAGRPRCR